MRARDERSGDGGGGAEAPDRAEAPIGRARALLSGADRVLVLTGAGVSADSGVPTFRGEQGLWKGHRPEELATPSAFRRDPRRVWEWYGMRRRAVAACEPNAAHLALARWSAGRPEAVVLATQNVDGLHHEALRRVAGAAADRSGAAAADAPTILELHGSLFRTRCTRCGARREDRSEVDASSPERLPRCEACGALLRPDVVWFGEPLDEEVLSGAARGADGCDVCLVVGTSAVVQPAASLATAAARSGAALVEVNPERTPLTRAAEVHLAGRAAEIVPALLDRA